MIQQSLKIYLSPCIKTSIFFASQHVLSSLTNMLMDIAVLEFICSQSPYSMKGLVFGLLYSIKALFQCLAVISFLPFGAQQHLHPLSCGSEFYVMTIVVGLAALFFFTCAARRYKYRVMNEPSNEYYSRIQ